MSSVGIYIEPHTNYVGIGTTLPSQNFHVQGTGYFKDGISAGNMTLFRNKIINGDMKINQRGSSVYVASGPSNMYTVDRFQAISTGHTLNTRPITLSASDQASMDENFTTAVALSPTPTDGLSVYYTFDGGSLLDSSGNGNHATMGAGIASNVPGRFGTNALYLSNEGNVITSSTQANNILTSTYNCPTTFTTSFWFMSTKLPVVSGQGNVLFTTNRLTSALTNAVVVYLYNLSGTISIWGAFNNTANTGPGTVISVNTWYHCAVTYNNGSLRIHINGNPVASALSGTMVTNGFSIGYARDASHLYPYAGYIDDFRIYTRVLTQPELFSLYQCTPTGISPDLSILTVPQGLYARLIFDNTASDSQGTLANPTPTGTTSYAINSRQGTYSLNLTANTAGSTTITTALTYTYTNSTLPISIAFWMNVTSIGVNYQIPVTMLNGANAVLQFYFDVGGFGFGIWSGTSTQYIAYSTGIVKANTWHHVCGVASYNALTQLYIDGIQVSTNNTPTGVFPTTTFGGGVTSLKIGSRDTSGSYAFRGYIDDVRIYTVALTSSQIAGLYYSQLQGYALYQQQIEGYTTADLGWGTTNAQPASLSCYLKNNTPTDQQFTFSIANSGAAAISAITFETSSGINDTLGLLTNPAGTNIAYSTGVYKVGTRSLDVTANPQGLNTNNAVTYITYPLPNSLTIPISMSLWFCIPTGATLQAGQSFITDCYSFAGGNNGGFSISLASTALMCDVWIGPNPTPNNGGYGANYFSTTYNISLTYDTWYHVVATAQNGDKAKLYLNGILVASSGNTCPLTGYIVGSAYGGISYPVTALRIGAYGTATYPFKGYIDDVRIYNRALNASEVLQIYNLNSLYTTISPYLLPRSLICKTPIIPSNTWQKVAISFTGDNNTSSWNMDTSAGIVVALCLASGSFYNAPSALTWNSITDYTVDNVQQYGYSSSHFMSSPGNSIYITGLQFEKGRIPTFYEVRPITMELQLCLRYFEFISRAVWGYGASVMNYGTYPFKVSKRAIPSAIGGSTFDSYYQITTEFLIVQRNNSTPDIQGVGFSAEL
jgi:hypothetical protein